MVMVDNFTRGGGESSPFNLESHTGDNGSTWTRASGSQTLVLSPDGFVRPGVQTNTVTYYTNSTSVGGDANYEVAGLYRWRTSSAAYRMVSLMLRNSGTSSFYAGYDTVADYFFIGESPTFTIRGSTVAPSSGLVAGEDYYLILSANGTSVTLSIYRVSTGLWLTSGGTFSSGTQVAAISYGSAGLSAGSAGFVAYANADGSDTLDYGVSTFEIGEVGTLTPPSGSMTASPTSVSTSQSGLTITLTGVNTFWSAQTFTVSGVTGVSKVSQNIASNTSATIVIDTGSTEGTLTISDGTISTTITVVAPPVTVAVTSSSIVWSPGNWYSDGAGAMGANNVKGSSTFAQTNCVGAYFRHRFTLSATGDVKLNLDTSMLSAVTSSGDRPILSVSLDGKAISTVQLTTVASSTQVTLASSVTSGDHTIDVWWKSTNFAGSYDRWNTPGVAVKITGVELPNGSTTPSTPTTRTYKALVFGDSITEGAEILGTGTGIANGDATQVYGALLGRALDAEVGIVGFSSQGWSQVGTGNVPVFSTAYASYWSGASRDWSDIDYIIINHGRNGSFTSNTVGTTVSAIASACPSAAIFVVPTFDRTGASTILAATLPGAAEFIDLGTLPEVKGNATGLWDSGAPHPNLRGHAAVAAMIATEIKATELAVAPSFGTFGAGRL